MGEKHQPQWAPIAEEWPVSHGSRVMINYIEQGTIKSKIKQVYELYRCNTIKKYIYRCDMTCTRLILLFVKKS